MGKYAVMGGYTSEAWAKMIDNPGDRVAAVRKTAEAVGANWSRFSGASVMTTTSRSLTRLTM
jgi:uncharacterized protein with GYD domain